MKLLIFTLALFFPFLCVFGTPPQACIAGTNTYFETVNAGIFTGGFNYSFDNETSFVTISNITADLPGKWDSKTVCVIPDNSKPLCVSVLNSPQSVTFLLDNSTFLVKAYLNHTETSFEIVFGWGVIDLGSFNFASGEIFSFDEPCANAFHNGTPKENLIKNLTQCCTAFKSVTESNISAPMCRKFKSRTTIYNVDDNYSIYSTVNATYTNEGNKWLAHGDIAGQNENDFFISLWLNNYDACAAFGTNNISCAFYVPNGDSKILFILEAANKTDMTHMPKILGGRLIFRNNQTLMEEGIPFTKNNDCDYYSRLYSPNQVSSSSFCCTDFYDNKK